MRKNQILIAFGFLIILASFSACNNSSENKNTDSNSLNDSSNSDSTAQTFTILQMMVPEQSAMMDTKIIKVSTFSELYKAIGSDRTIIVKAGSEIMIPDKPIKDLEQIYAQVENGLIISNCNNLKIKAEADKTTKITQTSAFFYVLQFNKCNNIIIEGITAGHKPKGFCGAGVIMAQDSKGIFIEKCHLYGCGIEGFTSINSTNVVLHKTEIYENSGKILSILQSKNIQIFDCILHNNVNGSGSMYLGAIEHIAFVNTVIENNDCSKLNPVPALFENEKVEDMHIVNCTISNNKATALVKSREGVVIKETAENNNSWQLSTKK
ncbi:MAG: right-handed parallel beta-helix repeat-containing protein [Bacteroidota bacterium]|nr:right-handed parallel beta-helix repeat-containing protein [Bacteroidota bacterium]